MCSFTDILAVLECYGLSGAIPMRCSSTSNDYAGNDAECVACTSGTIALTRQADEECLSLLQVWKC